jgi:hypothetical protein
MLRCGARLDELILRLLAARKYGNRGDAHIAIYHTSLLVDIRLIVVIDLEPGEQNLIFLSCHGALRKSA